MTFNKSFTVCNRFFSHFNIEVFNKKTALNNTDWLCFTCDAIFVSQQPELIHDTQHLDHIAGEERQLLRHAGEELEHSANQRSCFHGSSPAGGDRDKTPIQILFKKVRKLKVKSYFCKDLDTTSVSRLQSDVQPLLDR